MRELLEAGVGPCETISFQELPCITHKPAWSFLSPKTEVRASRIHERGLFARETIAKGEIVAVKGGHIFDRKTLRDLEPQLGAAEIQIDGDLFIGSTTLAIVKVQ